MRGEGGMGVGSGLGEVGARGERQGEGRGGREEGGGVTWLKTGSRWAQQGIWACVHGFYRHRLRQMTS